MRWFACVANLEQPWRWRIWWLFLVAWTSALIVPVPETPSLTIEEFNISLRTLFAKTLHVALYAFFAVLSAWLRVAQRWRWLLVYFLMVHATVTELIQLLVVSRTGQLTDVALDHLGIALGMLCTWKWWCAPSSESAEEPPNQKPFC